MTTSLDRTAVELPPPIPPLRRLLKHPRLMHYNRLAALVILANLGFLGAAWPLSERTLGHAALANLAPAIVVRQQYVINLFFKVATWAPTSWPLRVRWSLGKVYHFGGLHVGGALAGTAWFAALTLTDSNNRRAVAGWLLLTLLAAVIATALPRYLLDGPDLGAPGLLARHDFCPLSTMTRGVVSPGREAPVDR